MRESEYDLVVIGSGPAGQKGAIAAAKTRKRVAIIDRTVMLGGVSVHTGTIPSKTMREAIFQLTGFAVKALYGSESRGCIQVSIDDVTSRVKAIVARETEVIRAQLRRNGVAVYQGRGRFVDPHTVEVEGGEEDVRLRGEHILIAWGTHQMAGPYSLGESIPISLDPGMLPQYAVRTVLRMAAAMVLSLVFTLTYATLAAKSRRD